MDVKEFLELCVGDIVEVPKKPFSTVHTVLRGHVNRIGLPYVTTLSFATILPGDVAGVVKHDDPANKWTNGTRAWPDWALRSDREPGAPLFTEEQKREVLEEEGRKASWAREAALAQLREAVKDSTLTYADIAHAAGKSASWIGVCLRGKYPFDGGFYLPEGLADVLQTYGFEVPDILRMYRSEEVKDEQL